MPAMTRADFDAKSQEMATPLGNNLHKLMMKAYDAFTPEELDQLGDSNRPYLLVRAVAMHVGSQAIEDRFDHSAIARLKKKVNAILKKRDWYW